MTTDTYLTRELIHLDLYDLSKKVYDSNSNIIVSLQDRAWGQTNDNEHNTEYNNLVKRLIIENGLNKEQSRKGDSYNFELFWNNNEFDTREPDIDSLVINQRIGTPEGSSEKIAEYFQNIKERNCLGWNSFCHLYKNRDKLGGKFIKKNDNESTYFFLCPGVIIRKTFYSIGKNLSTYYSPYFGHIVAKNSERFPSWFWGLKPLDQAFGNTTFYLTYPK